MKKVYLIFVAGVWRVYGDNDITVKTFPATNQGTNDMVEFCNQNNFVVKNKTSLVEEYRDKLIN